MQPFRCLRARIDLTLFTTKTNREALVGYHDQLFPVSIAKKYKSPRANSPSSTRYQTTVSAHLAHNLCHSSNQVSRYPPGSANITTAKPKATPQTASHSSP